MYQNNFITPQCAAQSVGAANGMFLDLIQALLVAQCNISSPDMWPKDYGSTVLAQGLQDYDFIVVGAGSAGSVVASRLSENPEWKILLLEAGGDPPIESEIPGMSRSLQKSKVDWQFYIDTEVVCKAMNGRCYAPRGKMLGGCSAINSMIYIRGDRNDYDTWGELGNTGWDFESVLPYFRKSEGNQYAPFVDYENGRYHSESGPMKVDFFSEDGIDDYQKIFRDAAIERGNKILNDINAGVGLGYVIAQGTVFKARRQSTANAFLIPAKDRPNLDIIKYAFAQKILIDSNNTAFGIEFILNGQTFKAIARKEVIVSAGTYMSPHLLLLSGIGPKDDLEKLNIPVKSDIPVGKNLVDHHAVFVWFKFNATKESPLQELDNIYRLAIHNDGPLASIGVPTLNGFLNTVNGTGAPDFHIFVSYYKSKASSLKVYFDLVGYRADIQQALLKENQDHDIASVIVIKVHPLSRGYVKLASVSPQINPIINARYYTNDEDIKSTILAIKEQVSYTTTNSYRQNGGQFIHIPLAECDSFPFLSDDYYRCYIQYFGTTGSHPTSSSKMGPDSDPEAVVDDRLKVKNIKNLREIDAGIIPYTVSSNVNAATIMIGEKGSDLIKEDHGFIE